MKRGVFIKTIRSRGVGGVLSAIGRRLVPQRFRAFARCRHFLIGKQGIEIGGPSRLFEIRGLFPAYPIVGRIDNCNFRAETIWQKASYGDEFQYDKSRARGTQHYCEATDLNAVSSESCDFLLSSHVLEHVANPLRALQEWIRVLRAEGILAMIVPHGEATFDHRRPVTTLRHLIADFEQGVSEADTTHVAEVLELHDLARDPEAGDAGSFRDRTHRNLDNRGMHHHVFDTALAVELVNHSGLRILEVETTRPYHILVVAQKTKVGDQPNNEIFIGEHAPYRRLSPFSSDRRMGS